MTLLAGAICTTVTAQNGSSETPDCNPEAHGGSYTAAADSSTVALKGITVSGTRVIHKADRQLIYPTNEQKSAATSGYALLESIGLPGLRVDGQARTITSLTGRGAVQVRINGILADAAELSSLDTDAVVRIEYTDRPGLRYGEDTGHVINIIVRRATGGYAIGADLDNTITSASGSNSLFGRINSGSNQWEAAYTLTYDGEEHGRKTLDAAYIMPDGHIYNMYVADRPARNRSLQHDFGLTFSRTDSGRYVLQAKAGAQLKRMPGRSVWRSVTIPEGSYEACRTSSDREWQPEADLYWQQDFGRHQQLTANAVFTAFITDYGYADTEGSPYGYDVTGRSWSLGGEVIYENRLRPFTVTAGAQFRHKSIDNDYTGDVCLHNRSRSQTIYTFGQISGTLWHTDYTAGFGLSHNGFRHTSADYDFILMRPKLQIARPLGRSLKLTYDFEISQQVSAIANTNDVTLRRNLMETERGNPSLRPNRVTEHTLRLVCNVPRLSAYAEVYYKRNARPNLMKYLRETDDNGQTVFTYIQTNQPGCHLLTCQMYVRWQPLQGRLAVTAYGGPFRFFNYGDEYRHFYTSFCGGTMITAWLGDLTLTAYADSGFRWMEGENRGRQAEVTVFKVQWQHGNVALGLRWSHPLQSEVRSLRSETLSRYIRKDMEMRNSCDANRLSVNLVWTLNHGRKYRDIDRTTDNRDRDAGIMR